LDGAEFRESWIETPGRFRNSSDPEKPTIAMSFIFRVERARDGWSAIQEISTARKTGTCPETLSIRR
jgi:hypothetical protein